jgi:hypothetical protein
MEQQGAWRREWKTDEERYNAAFHWEIASRPITIRQSRGTFAPRGCRNTLGVVRGNFV